MNINTFHSIVNLNVHPFSHICSYYSFGLAVEANQGNPNSTEIELGPAQPQLVYLLFGCNSPPKSAWFYDVTEDHYCWEWDLSPIRNIHCPKTSNNIYNTVNFWPNKYCLLKDIWSPDLKSGHVHIFKLSIQNLRSWYVNWNPDMSLFRLFKLNKNEYGCVSLARV